MYVSMRTLELLVGSSLSLGLHAGLCASFLGFGAGVAGSTGVRQAQLEPAAFLVSFEMNSALTGNQPPAAALSRAVTPARPPTPQDSGLSYETGGWHLSKVPVRKLTVLAQIAPSSPSAAKPRAGGTRSAAKIASPNTGQKKIQAPEQGLPSLWSSANPSLRILSLREPEYPEIARRQGVEGRVLLEVTVQNTSNAAVAVRVLESSGSQLLDQAALQALKEAQFELAEGLLQEKRRIAFRFALQAAHAKTPEAAQDRF